MILFLVVRKLFWALALTLSGLVGLVSFSGGAAGAATATPEANTISGGAQHTCAIEDGGQLLCWGDDLFGQLGDDPMFSGSDFTPRPVVGMTDVVSVSAGDGHTCAVRSSGSVYCWGSNRFAETGAETDGSYNAKTETPVRVVGISDAVSVSADASRSCAVHATGEVSCWGWNSNGFPGDGTFCSQSCSGRSKPAKVIGLTNAVSVSVGPPTCALLRDGAISCWGYNRLGTLGDGTESHRSTPTRVIGISDAVALSTSYATGCAVRSAGTVFCWGSSIYGRQVGPGTDIPHVHEPEQIPGVTGAISVALGKTHSCALLGSGKTTCWGSNGSGQRGLAAASAPTSAAVVPGISNAVSITAGRETTCILEGDGTMSCWGDNGWQQLGSSSWPQSESFQALEVAGLQAVAMPRSVSGLLSPKADQMGYWMLSTVGEIFAFGDAPSFLVEDLTESGLTVVGFDRASDGSGLWLVDSLGTVYVEGSATHYGNVDVQSLAPGDQIATISATPSGNGYWVFTDLGAALAFGDASHFGDLPTLGITPSGAVVASASTPTGNGYYMLGSDGGVFAFGDAEFGGSIPQVLPGVELACPIVGLVPVPTGKGYWLVACDGGVFAFGNAYFVGSLPGVLPAGTAPNAPVNGMVPYADGYLMVASDGGVFNFSSEQFLGSLGSVELASPIAAITAFSS